MIKKDNNHKDIHPKIKGSFIIKSVGFTLLLSTNVTWRYLMMPAITKIEVR